MKQLHKGKSVRWFDWVATVLAGLFNVGFFIWGIMSINKDNLTFGILAAGFGYGGLMQVRSQIKNFVKPPTDKHQWFYNHIGNMIGGFIASVTAFSANVLTFMPGIVQWLWPSLIGVPIIVFWIRSYRKKLEGGTPISNLVKLTLRS